MDEEPTTSSGRRLKMRLCGKGMLLKKLERKVKSTLTTKEELYLLLLLELIAGEICIAISVPN